MWAFTAAETASGRSGVPFVEEDRHRISAVKPNAPHEVDPFDAAVMQ
jgi:hypothetical protein